MTQSNSALSLPLPDEDGLQLSEQLVKRIRHLIAMQDGMIGFDQYMTASLYEPGLGYYSAGSKKFGAKGDFVTAPEISPIFSRCLANQCAQILNDLGGGIIFELGAGTGLMAKDLLLELEKQNALPKEYWIFEISADLEQRQQQLIRQAIPHFKDRIKWLDSLPEQPFAGLILANEVLDALPVKRFLKTKRTFNELKVGFDNGTFIWLTEKANTDLLNTLERLDKKLKTPLPEGYISEINVGLEKWLASIASTLKKGVILFMDYGYSEADYYHTERNNGTLLCHYRHHVHSDPFLYPGLQDMTASINFTALAETADRFGMTVSGYTTQAYFLFGCDLEGLLANMNELDIKSQIKTAQQVRILTLAEEMGERFKVMALTKQFNHAISGFSIMDQRIRL